MNPRNLLAATTVAVLLAVPTGSGAYPLDDYPRTGITRLEAYDRAREGLLARGTLKPGSLWPSADIRLRLAERPELELPAADPEFSRELRDLLGPAADRYGVAVLDLSDLDAIRYAEHQGNLSQNPGSVGKLLVELAWLQALADRGAR